MAPHKPAPYKQHRPEETALFPLIRDHLEGFLLQCCQSYRSGLPRFVEKELREYLKCGIHAYGFARAKCDDCGGELLLAFSCKKRGVCPSCNARRMCDTAARLIDRVLPDVRLRQWVLSVPFALRLILAKNPEALSACGRIFVEEIFRWQRLVGLRRGLVPSEDGRHLLRGGAVSIRVVRWLTRRGIIAADEPDSSCGVPTTLEACLSSSLGLGDLATLKQDKLAKQGPHSPESVSKRARGGEFNVHASVTATAKEDRERLVRYCARAPLSLERLSVSKCGKVVYQLRHPIRGKTHRIMEPYQFLARLCALIPPPRHPLIRFHGVLAPNSAWRKEVVPQSSAPEQAPPCADGGNNENDEARAIERWEGQRLDWATLLKRVHGIDALACPCGGRLTFIELIEDRKEAVAQLLATGLSVYLPPKRTAKTGSGYDCVDDVPEEDWDQSNSADDSTPDPIWDDP